MIVPNHTQVPNEFIDKYMFDLSGAAVKVFFAICRKTIGWHKECDSISCSQLSLATGLSRVSCSRAIKELEEAGHILVERGAGKINRVDIRFDTYNKMLQVPVSKSDNTCIKKLHTKETLQNKEIPLLPMREAIGFYQDLYTLKTGIKPAWDGKIVKLLKADLGRFSLEVWRGLVNQFFASPPDFVVKNDTGFGYNIFHSMIEKLVYKRAREAKRVAKVVPCDVCGAPTEREFGYQVCKVHGRRENLE